jgi:hypothetical protein
MIETVIRALKKLQKLGITAVKNGTLKLTISLRCAMSLATPKINPRLRHGLYARVVG